MFYRTNKRKKCLVEFKLKVDTLPGVLEFAPALQGKQTRLARTESPFSDMNDILNQTWAILFDLPRITSHNSRSLNLC